MIFETLLDKHDPRKSRAFRLKENEKENVLSCIVFHNEGDPTDPLKIWGVSEIEADAIFQGIS